MDGKSLCYTEPSLSSTQPQWIGSTPLEYIDDFWFYFVTPVALPIISLVHLFFRPDVIGRGEAVAMWHGKL